jgi:sarcosine oxidase, subunit gamma
MSESVVPLMRAPVAEPLRRGVPADAPRGAGVPALPVLRSPLGERLSGHAQTAADRAGVMVAEWPHVACIVLRGRADDRAFVEAAARVLCVSLPATPSTLTAGTRHVVLWMSPDEWWVLLPRDARDAVFLSLRTALAGVFAQVVDASGSLTCLRLAGPEHITVLRHLSPYDFEAMPLGRCVSTVMPKAFVTVVRTDGDGVMLLFRRSFADWVWRLVERSALPYGLAVCRPHQLPAAHFSALLSNNS